MLKCRGQVFVLCLEGPEGPWKGSDPERHRLHERLYWFVHDRCKGSVRSLEEQERDCYCCLSKPWWWLQAGL